MEFIKTEENIQIMDMLVMATEANLSLAEKVSRVILSGSEGMTYKPSKRDVEIIKRTHNVKSDKEAFTLAYITGIAKFAAMDGVDTENDAEKIEILNNFADVVFEGLQKHFKVFNTSMLAGNPFLSKVKFSDKRYGKFYVEHIDMYQYQPIPAGPEFSEGIISYPSVGYIEDGDFSFPAIVDGEQMHDYVMPDTITGAEPLVERAEGNVLSLGLGIGYFEFMAQRKDSVKSITVVERDKDLIELFRNEVMPAMEHPEKIKIVQADPYSYLNSLKEKFDCCIVDIETGPDPSKITDSYLLCKTHEKRFPETQFLYMGEPAIICDIIDLIVCMIINNIIGIDTNQDKDLSHEEKRAIKKLEKIYKDTVLFRMEDILSLFIEDNIKTKIIENI